MGENEAPATLPGRGARPGAGHGRERGRGPLMADMRKAAGKLLEEHGDVCDVYRGAQVAAGKKSVAFSLTFRAPDRTLTDEGGTGRHGQGDARLRPEAWRDGEGVSGAEEGKENETTKRPAQCRALQAADKVRGAGGSSPCRGLGQTPGRSIVAVGAGRARRSFRSRLQVALAPFGPRCPQGTQLPFGASGGPGNAQGFRTRGACRRRPQEAGSLSRAGAGMPSPNRKSGKGTGDSDFIRGLANLSNGFWTSEGGMRMTRPPPRSSSVWHLRITGPRLRSRRRSGRCWRQRTRRCPRRDTGG